jgi:hypothetical protein
MVRLAILAAMLSGAAPLTAQPTPASVRLPAAHAAALFESDWVLMNWALKNFDRDGDVLLSTAESQAAADAFRKIADTNGDGRVTPQEFRAARAFILARD